MSLQTKVPDVAKCHDSRRTCRQQETNCQSTDVDEAIGSPELVAVVGDVGEQVGGLAGAAHQHPVNIFVHMIGIPTIMLGVFIALSWLTA